MARPLLTEEDRKIIAQAIASAERRTSGEIVFGLTDASSGYRHATFQGALAGMILCTALYLVFPLPHSINRLLWTELLSFLVCYALFSRLSWRKWFISAAEMDERVRDAAFMEFYASRLYRTREENGVLIYLSQFEHRVVILGDRGIHEKMGDAHWGELRDLIIRGIRKGRARESVCEAIAMCGEALARHFPRRTDDVNELDDRVIDRTRDSV